MGLGVMKKLKELRKKPPVFHVVVETDPANPFYGIPSFAGVPHSEHTSLFRKKVVACKPMYDFSADTCLKEKEQKRQTLLELIQYIKDTKNWFHGDLVKDMISMTSAHIFRALPCRQRWMPFGYDPEAEEPCLEESWEHLQLVYELFLRFIDHDDVDPKFTKRYVDETFIVRIVEIFESEDARERDYVKTILHRMYRKFKTLRPCIRRRMTDVFYFTIYGRDFQNGVAELLEIFGSIINGFALPLKKEHRDLLFFGLIPLHKVKHVELFHQQLSYCLQQFAEKDTRLTVKMMEALLRYWPFARPVKEVLFLSEIEELLELAQPADFLECREAVFSKICSSICSTHFQVAERALFFWNNDFFLKLIAEHREALYPMIIPALYTNAGQHWNTNVHDLTLAVLKQLMETDGKLFDVCSRANASEIKKKKKMSVEDDKRKTVWASYEARCLEGLARGEKEAPRGKLRNLKSGGGIKT